MKAWHLEWRVVNGILIGVGSSFIKNWLDRIVGGMKKNNSDLTGMSNLNDRVVAGSWEFSNSMQARLYVYTMVSLVQYMHSVVSIVYWS